MKQIIDFIKENWGAISFAVILIVSEILPFTKGKANSVLQIVLNIFTKSKKK